MPIQKFTNSNQQADLTQARVFDRSQRPITLFQYFPCLILCSEAKPGTEQSTILAELEAELRKQGFSPTYWKNYGNQNLEAPWEQYDFLHSLFSIVLLDGLTPNLLYKYGILKGLGKSVIVLQSKNAQTQIKGLYKAVSESGLDAKVFHHDFADPLIDLSSLLPLFNIDYLGIIDQTAPDQPLQLTPLFQKAFRTMGSGIMEALKNRLLPQIPQEYIEEFLTNFGIFEDYYHTLFEDSEYQQIASLQTVYPSIKRAAEYYHFTIPLEFARLLASLSIFQAIHKRKNDHEKQLLLHLALEIDLDQLESAGDQEKKALISKEIGAIHTELLLSSGSNEHAKEAVNHLHYALQIYTREIYPLEFGMIQNNLGIVQLQQTLSSPSRENLQTETTLFQQAVESFQAVAPLGQIANFNLGLSLSAVLSGAESDKVTTSVLEIRTALNEFVNAANMGDGEPEILARINQNCGLLNLRLIDAEPTEAAYKASVKFLKEALQYWNGSTYPIESAMAHAIMGEAALKTAYRFDSAQYFQQAINEFFEFFKVYPYQDSLKWARIERYLGDAYLGLAKFEKKIAHSHSAISFYSEALEYFNIQQFPDDFFRLHSQLADIYHFLAEAENSAPNYQHAISSWTEVLKGIPGEEREKYTQINLKIAQAYHKLATMEIFLENTRQANNIYHKVTEFLETHHDTENQKPLYQEALWGLGNTAFDLATHEETLENYHQALEAFEGVLHSGPTSNELQLQSRIGDICWNLARLEKHPLSFCKKGTAAYEIFLAHNPSVKNTGLFAFIQPRLGDLYAIAADYEEQTQNYQAGIDAYQTALQWVLTSAAAPGQERLISPGTQNIEDGEPSADGTETLLTIDKIAAIHKKRGDLLLKMAALENLAIHYKAAIADYDGALQYFTRMEFPKEYAEIHRNRGAIFQKLTDIEGKADNLHQAIPAYGEALKIYTLEETPAIFGSVQKELGMAYSNRFQFEQGTEDCRNAIEAFRFALEAYPKEKEPLEYATIQNLLGNALFNLAESAHEDSALSSSADIYDLAVAAFEEAAALYGDESLTQDFGAAQMNLGIAYANLARVHKDPEQYQKAISVYEKILASGKLEKHSFEDALIHFKMGEAFEKSAALTLTGTTENLKKAIDAYEESLKVFKISGYPIYYAAAYKGIAGVYGILSAHQKQPAVFGKIFEAYQEVLRVYTSATPLYASIQQEMGDLYTQWAMVEKPLENYRHAAESYQESLTVWTQKNDVSQYKKTQRKLASIFVKIAELKDPVHYYRKAVDSLQEALPDNADGENSLPFSTIQEELGDLFYQLARMEQNDHFLAQGILAYENATTSSSIRYDVLRYTALQEKQGDCFSLAAEFEDPNSNYQKALQFYQNALKNLDSSKFGSHYAEILIKAGQVSENLATLENKSALHQQATDYLLKSLPFTAEDFKRSADTYQRIGDIYSKPSPSIGLNHCRKAIQMYQQSALLYEENNYIQELALLQIKIGTIYQKLAEFEDSTDNFQKALEMFSNAGKILDYATFPGQFTVIQYQLGNIHYMLAKTTDALDSYHNAMLCYETALPNLRTDAKAGEAYVTSLKNLGAINNHLLELTDLEEFLTKSIAIFQELLHWISKEQSPLEYAEYQIIIAQNLSKQATIHHSAADYQSAILSYQAAMEFFSDRRDPLKLALIQRSLADIYYQLAFLNNSPEDLKESIQWYQTTLPYYLDSDPKAAPPLYQRMGMNFGKLFDITQDITFLKEALTAFGQGIKFFEGLTPKASPTLAADFLLAMNHQMGELYRKLATEESTAKESHLKNSISHYELVIEKMRESAHARENTVYPLAFQSLGEVYLLLAEIYHDRHDASQVIANCQAALKNLQEAWEVKADPTIQYLSGRSLYLLAQYDEPFINFPKALISFGESLQFWTFEQHAVRWAEIQHRMGETYFCFAEFADKVIHYRHAIESFQSALKIRTYGYLPLEYGKTQMELAGVYRELAGIEGSLTHYNLAIEGYSEASRVFVSEIYPEQYIRCQCNLGEIHHLLTEYESPEAHELTAIAAYHNALKVLENYKAEPGSGVCHFNLGNSYLKLATISKSSEYSQKAISSYQSAQAAGINPQILGDFHQNLGTAHSIVWESANNSQNKDQALYNLRLALAQYRKYELWVPFALTQHKIGQVFLRTALNTMKPENWKNAMEAFQDSLRVLSNQDQPEYNAVNFEKLGESYHGLAQWENPGINYTRAIDAYSDALKIWNRERFPRDFSRVQQKLGLTYERLAELEEKNAHLNSALTAYRKAIKAQSIEESPSFYADLQKSLGIILNTLGEEADALSNCQAAIVSFEEALRVFSRENYPLDYAVVRHHLGNSHRILAKYENEIIHCQKAITYYEEAITLFDSMQDNLNSLDFAILQNNLGNAYLMISDLKNTEEYSIKAVASFKNALKYYDPKTHPNECASLQGNIGKTLQHLAEVTSELAVYREAAAAYQEALQVYTVQSFPNQFAITQWNLGRIYLNIAKLVAPAENYSRAVTSLLAALNILRIKDLINATRVQYKLGIAYNALADFNDKGGNCKLALQSLEEALKKKNFEQAPLQTVVILLEQGLAFQKLAAVEDGEENYPQSVSCFEKALSIIADEKQETIPERFKLQKALGDSYYALAALKPEVETLRKSSENYFIALEYFTSQNYPTELGLIQKNLGTIFIRLAHYGNKLNHCKQAIKAFQEALKIYTLEQQLKEHIAIMNDLGDAHRLLSESEEELANYQKAVECWKSVLESSPVEFDNSSTMAMVRMKLAEGYHKFYRAKHLIDDSKQALFYFESALKIATQKRLDQEQLDILFKMGLLYVDLALGQSANPSAMQQNYKKAIQAFREIIKASSPQYMSKNYGDSQNVLGTIYLKMADNEKNAGNLKLAIRCFEEALKVRNVDNHSRDYAQTQVNLGDAYFLSQTPDAHYPLAIQAYQEAADIYHENRMISDYSPTLYKLGKAYRAHAESTLDPQFFQKAITCFEEFLSIGLVVEHSQDCADTKVEIGHLYLKIGQVQEPETNYPAAIGYYTSAAALFLQLKATDRVWQTQCDLGEAYHQLARIRERIEDFKNAIHAYEDALKFLSKQENPQEYALVQKNLGEIYESLSSLGYETEYLEKAVHYYKESLTCLNDKDFYFNIIQQHLGEAYLRLANFNDTVNNCNKAIDALKKSLPNRNGKHSVQQSSIWNSIAQSYALLASESRDAGYWNKAINAYREALKNGTNEEENPKRSTIQMNLGKALFHMAEYEDRVDNCKLAIYVCQEALQGLASSVQDLECSQILSQLGNAYYILAVAESLKGDEPFSWTAYQEFVAASDLGKAPEWFTIAYSVPEKEPQSLAIIEEKKSNSLQAIESFQKAMEIYTYDKNSYGYALLMQTLGNAYQTSFEVDGNHDNLKNAIFSYQEALNFWTVENNPLVYVNTSKCLGNAYQKLARREDIETNAKKAIEFYEAALTICPFERFPLNYGIFYDNIKACCYLLAENENNVEIYKKIFEACEEALKVFTKHKFPKKYRLLRYEMDNLVNLLID